LKLYQPFEILYAHIRNIYSVEVEAPDKLGDKELDNKYNWGIHIDTYT
jgi:hypothetical protein